MKNYKINEFIKADGSKEYRVYEISTYPSIYIKARWDGGGSKQQRADELLREAKIRSKTTTCEYKIEIPNNIQTIDEIKTYLKSRTIVETNEYNISL